MTSEDRRNLVCVPGPDGKQRREKQLRVNMDNIEIPKIASDISPDAWQHWIPEQISDSWQPVDFEFIGLTILMI